MSRASAKLIACAALLVAGCTESTRYAIVTVEDPDGLASTATSIYFGEALTNLRALALSGKDFPLTFGIEGERNLTTQLWVEARDAAGVTLGRGRGALKLRNVRTTTVQVRLTRPCDADADCLDELYCDGTGVCRDNMCAAQDQPCSSAFSYVITSCIEIGGGNGQCNVVVDHALCPAESYCDPGGGCIVGKRCETDGDCQDASVCNGAEVCNRFRCEGGALAILGDGDDCTLDGCDDARTARGEAAIFHAALPSFDGSPCTKSDGSGEVCVSAKGGCVASECADGVRFGAEACDSGVANSEAWSLDQHCNTTCTAWAPSCGDNALDAPFEGCDDGARADSGNGCSDTCQRTAGACGDSVRQSLFEECDDGNADECDGCTTSCEVACVCSTLIGCPQSTSDPDPSWCDDAATCRACDTAQHCGVNCTPCDASEWCEPAVGCTPCNTTSHCGPGCTACTATEPVCDPVQGADVGCVTASCSGKPDGTRCTVQTTPDRAFDVCVSGLCVSPGSATYGDGVDRAAICLPDLSQPNVWYCAGPDLSYARADAVAGWQMPDTGQRTCADASMIVTCSAQPCAADGSPAYCGQDAQYGWDANGDGTRYQRTTVGDEPVVFDELTGLTWLGCIARLSGTACDVGSPIPSSWPAALAYCDDLTWGGFHDWRLPDIDELWTLIDLGYVTHVDPVAFPASPAGQQWSSTPRWQPGTLFPYARTVRFAFGESAYWTVNDTMGFRCVRGGLGVGAGPPRFQRTSSSQRVVIDRRAGLEWQGCPAGLSGVDCVSGSASTSTWQQALAYCEGSSWDGKTDWRLPSLLELASVVARRSASGVDPMLFPRTPSAAFWSSSTLPASASSAGGVSFLYGTSSTYAKGDAQHVRCVRDATVGLCGNGSVDSGEVCDDGQRSSCGACNADCSGTGSGSLGACGDGVTCGEAGETCDDGNASNADACPDGAGGSCADASCGDGFIGTVGGITESCDDRNVFPCGQCDATCSAQQAPGRATGTITFVGRSQLVDGEYFVLNDGFNPMTTFEFDVSGNGVESGRVRLDVSTLSNASQVRDLSVAAINAADSTLLITATADTGATAALAHDRVTGLGNRNISDVVGNSAFAVIGMFGGAAYDCPEGFGCMNGADCVSGVCSAFRCTAP